MHGPYEVTLNKESSQGVLTRSTNEYILNELSMLSDLDWWDLNVERHGEAEEKFWAEYYNLVEEEAIKRGLL